MKIYTKTGDRGKTSLGSGERVWKNSSRVEAYGTVDELNAVLGAVASEIENSEADLQYIFGIVEGIQKDLFALGAYIANPQRESLVEGFLEKTTSFEREIDKETRKLPEIRNFILPGGARVGALFHVARTLCRRAERKLVALMQEEKVDDNVVKYINRLSDLLFTMARFANKLERKKEIIWRR